jgi:hypothetical protein
MGFLDGIFIRNFVLDLQGVNPAEEPSKARSISSGFADCCTSA